MWTDAAISSTVTGCAKCARIAHGEFCHTRGIQAQHETEMPMSVNSAETAGWTVPHHSNPADPWAT